MTKEVVKLAKISSIGSDARTIGDFTLLSEGPFGFLIAAID
jgi:hypothetical protein